MKKVFVFTIFAIFSLIVVSQINAQGIQVPLIADGGKLSTRDYVGRVNIDEFPYDPNTLSIRIEIYKNAVVKYHDDEGNLINELKGWIMGMTHMHAAANMEDIPQTKKGNPIPGLFGNSQGPNSPDGQPYITKYRIPKIWKAGTWIYIATHAEMVIPDDKKPIYESAWGEGMPFPGSNWAMCIPYYIWINPRP